MQNFIFHNPVKIYFGKGQAAHVADEAAAVRGPVLLVYGGGSIKRNGAYDDVMAALRRAGSTVVELPGVTPNPRLDKVVEGVRLVREHGVGLILAVGGGSAIDCAKFIALGAGIGEDEDLWDDYVETGRPAPEGLVPLGVVLTTAATGSEMGDAAVLTNPERNRKLGYVSFPLTPRFSVLDPSYLLTLPDEQTTYGFVDMFCHTCEQYLSLPDDDNLSDEMAEAIQRHILRSWRACRRDPRDYEARSNAMWDSTLALNRVISRGKDEDWVTHGIEHAISAYFDIPHGAGLAIVHPHWMRYVYDASPEATARFARWAVNVWGVDATGKSARVLAQEGIERYVDFLRRVGAPLTLAEAGVPSDPATLDALADHAGEAGGSYRRITRDDARAILASCVEPVGF
ncbi:iron-containing alcohol dehydrogenase [Bifidobacterium phasiani]|uniref:Iron-containing alcohol dehydrogenase n=1 Tax=Bifidobacterium phasiani TaxID=2834431 RepID=A0ABS6WAH1_9BIFI|nr:iron-containing alcohol dehydrogenase [Bifidobacterium phasiani]MBW3083479.1 iron-containing alcohol dehydrogenase [Bifidobacterium phasiani]